MAHDLISVCFPAAKALGRIFLEQLGTQITRLLRQEVEVKLWLSVLNVLIELLPVLRVEWRQTDEHLINDGAK